MISLSVYETSKIDHRKVKYISNFVITNKSEVICILGKLYINKQTKKQINRETKRQKTNKKFKRFISLRVYVLKSNQEKQKNKNAVTQHPTPKTQHPTNPTSTDTSHFQFATKQKK